MSFEQRLNTESPDVEMSSDVDIKETISRIGETVKNNKLLVGAVALGCGAAIFLLATDSGKRLRVQIQDRALDLYDDISEVVADQWDRLQDTGQDVMSRKSNEQVAEDLRHIA
jgi:gas vesicle protein